MPTAAMRRPTFEQGAYLDEFADEDDVPVLPVDLARVAIRAMPGTTLATAGSGTGQVAGDGCVTLATPRLFRLARRTGMDPDCCVAELRALLGDGQPSSSFPGKGHNDARR